MSLALFLGLEAPLSVAILYGIRVYVREAFKSAAAQAADQ